MKQENRLTPKQRKAVYLKAAEYAFDHREPAYVSIKAVLGNVCKQLTKQVSNAGYIPFEGILNFEAVPYFLLLCAAMCE